MRTLRLAIPFLMLCVFTACWNTAPIYKTITEPRLSPGNTVPVPTGPVILSISGKIGLTNVGDRLDFDLATLEQIGLIEYQVDDPDMKYTVTHTGVLLEQVLKVAQISPDAKELFTTALDDYKIAIPIDVTTRWPVMIATLRDGQRIPANERGPIEIVFPNKHFSIDPLLYDPMWVWQLRTMEVR